MNESTNLINPSLWATTHKSLFDCALIHICGATLAGAAGMADQKRKQKKIKNDSALLREPGEAAPRYFQSDFLCFMFQTKRDLARSTEKGRKKPNLNPLPWLWRVWRSLCVWVLPYPFVRVREVR